MFLSITIAQTQIEPISSPTMTALTMKSASQNRSVNEGAPEFIACPLGDPASLVGAGQRTVAGPTRHAERHRDERAAKHPENPCKSGPSATGEVRIRCEFCPN